MNQKPIFDEVLNRIKEDPKAVTRIQHGLIDQEYLIKSCVAAGLSCVLKSSEAVYEVSGHPEFERKGDDENITLVLVDRGQNVTRFIAGLL